MKRISSYELSQWIAYERASGPLGQIYSQDMLAQIHEQLQAIQYILGAQAAGEESPVPIPFKQPRPSDIFNRSAVVYEQPSLREAQEPVDPELMDIDTFNAYLDKENGVTPPDPEKPVQVLPGTESMTLDDFHESI